jgi:hypothetical protein
MSANKPPVADAAAFCVKPGGKFAVKNRIVKPGGTEIGQGSIPGCRANFCRNHAVTVD